MADEANKSQGVENATIQRLIKETGITEEQARELISFIGIEWPSLFREARLLTKKR